MSIWRYWLENVKLAFSEWRVGNSFVALIVALLVAFGYEAAREPAFVRAVAWFGVLYILGLLLTLTPQRMWIQAQRRIHELEEQAKPQLQLIFEPDKPPFLQEVNDGAAGNPWERRYRVGIRNDSSQVIRDVRVVLESFDQLIDGELHPTQFDQPIFIEHALNIMGRDNSEGLVDVAPGDRPTAYADVIAQRLNSDRTEGDWMSPCYPGTLGTAIFSRATFVFVLRVEGGGTFSRARFKVEATLENRLITMSRLPV
jgi:hypothetical protein